MIITTNNDSKTPLKASPTPAPNSSQSTSGSPPGPPPSYGAYQHIQQPYPARHVVVEQGFVYRQSPSRRFWRAFFVAILVWLLLSMLAQSIAGLAYWNGRYTIQHQWIGNFPIPSNIVLGDCVSGDRWFAKDITNQSAHSTPQSLRFRHSSEASFDLPFSAENLFLLARGSQSHGAVNVETSKTGDNVKVHVTASYYDRDILKTGAKVCLIRRKNKEVGVGIFTRTWVGRSWGSSELYFDTTVIIPESVSGDKIRHIKGFETDVSNSPHYIGDLHKLVNFQNINIKTSNAPIHIESIHATKGDIVSSNGPIEGTFNTSDHLFLKTTNAHIRVDVGLGNDNTHITSLRMGTTNSKLEANLDLVSSTGTGGRYAVAASTTNGPLRVNFPASPNDSSLNLSATTTNSPADVSLHPSYEGSFQLSTTQFTPQILRRDVEDPSGRGRRRNVDLDQRGRGSLKGSVSWSSTEGPGSVTVRSTNAHVSLEL